MNITINIILICLLFITGCKKDETFKNPDVIHEDYRNQYSGDYKFVTIHSVVVMQSGGGWNLISLDTIFYLGNISPFDTNRIKINFNAENYLTDSLTYVHYPIIDQQGNLTYPEYPVGGHNHINNYWFLDSDSVILDFVLSGLIGGYHQYEVFGKKH